MDWHCSLAVMTEFLAGPGRPASSKMPPQRAAAAYQRRRAPARALSPTHQLYKIGDGVHSTRLPNAYAITKNNNITTNTSTYKTPNPPPTQTHRTTKQQTSSNQQSTPIKNTGQHLNYSGERDRCTPINQSPTGQSREKDRPIQGIIVPQ